MYLCIYTHMYKTISQRQNYEEDKMFVKNYTETILMQAYANIKCKAVALNAYVEKGVLIGLHEPDVCESAKRVIVIKCLFAQV